MWYRFKIGSWIRDKRKKIAGCGCFVGRGEWDKNSEWGKILSQKYWQDVGLNIKDYVVTST